MYKSLYVKSPNISIYRYRLVMGFLPVGMLNSLTFNISYSFSFWKCHSAVLWLRLLRPIITIIIVVITLIIIVIMIIIIIIIIVIMKILITKIFIQSDMKKNHINNFQESKNWIKGYTILFHWSWGNTDINAYVIKTLKT